MEDIEHEIVSKIETQYADKVKDTLGNITAENGKINVIGLWKSTNKVFLRNSTQVPIAFKDKQGNLLTGHESINQYALQSIVERLRKRPIHPELTKLGRLKTKLTQLRLKMCKQKKTPKWTMRQLDKAIKSMKTKKCRDSYGMVNELFKPGIAGHDFKLSILSLMNETKKRLEIPYLMQNVNVALIPKPGKRDIKNIENHRGIFLINKFRGLIMRLLLNDKYNTIDKYMSDSNVGGRKGRSIRDHLFILNGIIHDHYKSKYPISIQILDYASCFDSMCQNEVFNDLYDAGIKDDKLSLLYDINATNHIAVKTPVGISNRVTVNNIICQGDPWGSIQCSLMTDNFGKDSLKPEMEPYKYKGFVPIPILTMVDDILAISYPGYHSQRMNAFLNAKTAIKKLQFGPKKCHVIYIGKNIPEYKKMDLHVDGWKMEEVTDKITGATYSNEVFDGEHFMGESKEEKYLGQIVSSDGTNTKNIKYRVGKGIGMSNIICSILSYIPGGKFHFQNALIYRNAYFLSSMLSSCEAWYNLTKTEVNSLEKCDEVLLRKILGCSRQVPSEMLYLTLGILPIKFILIIRRLMYLHHILQQKYQKTLLYQFFEAQWKNPKCNDWVSQIREDLNEIAINEDFNEIELLSENKFKIIVKDKVKKKAFNTLNLKKERTEKYKKVIFKSFKIADYLNESDISVKQRQFLFQCIVSDIDVRTNRRWKYSDTHCVSCTDTSQEESQMHILQCSALSNNNDLITYIPSYSDLYSSDINEQVYVSSIIRENLRIRDTTPRCSM